MTAIVPRGKRFARELLRRLYKRSANAPSRTHRPRRFGILGGMHEVNPYQSPAAVPNTARDTGDDAAAKRLRSAARFHGVSAFVSSLFLLCLLSARGLISGEQLTLLHVAWVSGALVLSAALGWFAYRRAYREGLK